MWPFQKRWKPKPGDHVRIVFEQDGVPFEGTTTTWTRTVKYIRSGVIVEATQDGKHIRVEYVEPRFPKGKWLMWVEKKQAEPTTVLEDEAPRKTPLVDARVLEVVVELQRAVGDTDALIDLLWSVGSAYGVKKEQAS